MTTGSYNSYIARLRDHNTKLLLFVSVYSSLSFPLGYCVHMCRASFLLSTVLTAQGLKASCKVALSILAVATDYFQVVLVHICVQYQPAEARAPLSVLTP
ncbi:TPA: hypothetical protein ACH3X1_012718 [Trebouxia sp. C0004]